MTKGYTANKPDEEEKKMKARNFLFIALMVALAVCISVPAQGGGPFDKDYVNPRLSCVGIQLLDSGKIELQSPSEASRTAFYAVHGQNMGIIIDTVRRLGAEYDGQCTHRNNSNSGNWLPICRLR